MRAFYYVIMRMRGRIVQASRIVYPQGARERPLCARYVPFCFAADIYPTVKAVLRHESPDSDEDRKGLGCHLGIKKLKMRCIGLKSVHRMCAKVVIYVAVHRF